MERSSSNTLRPPDTHNLPFVATSPKVSMPDLAQLDGTTRTTVPEITLTASRSSTARGRKMSAISKSSIFGGSIISLDRFSNFEIDDLTNLSMNNQRWSLNRDKIGLSRKTRASQEHLKREKTRDINLSFICSNFTRKECVMYVKNKKSNAGRCHCGLLKEKHLSPNDLIPRAPLRPVSSVIPNFETVIEEAEGEVEESEAVVSKSTLQISHGNHLIEPRGLLSSRSRVYPMTTPPPPRLWPTQELPSPDANWDPKTHLRELPTNAYGRIIFPNESYGSHKPAKYLRVSDTTNMQSVLTLLTDYWRLQEPHRPQLVISVTGGAKNFRLDGKKKETFSSGLIKAVKSTDAWLITAGGNVGVTRSVGQAVNQGQYLTKVKRKMFAQEQDHMVRGIRCLGVCPWGYTKDRDLLVGPDPTDFVDVKYKITTTEFHQPVSLNGDHTHFLLVDDGSRNMFSGSDDFRTRLEEAIQEEEPKGLGVPVVLLVLEGGISALEKCEMALMRNIPVVVVNGTGRAADLIAYAVSLTVKTPSGQYIFRKSHEAQLRNRITLLMSQLHGNATSVAYCLEKLIECCSKADMITIFDINSNEGLDKYILYALMTGKKGSFSSRQDQLHLALLWNRPDIAEAQIFPSKHTWSLGVLEDLMTTALLEEKVEFVKLFVINGLVMEDYLTIGRLRLLYNQACIPNSHMSRLLQRASKSWHYTLIHVHNLLQAMVKKHYDKNYLTDTPDNIANDPNISSKIFEDPYNELLLWAILSSRGQLARYLWERCNSPLCAAVVASCMYQALWKSLGKKNTDIRQEYLKQKVIFENLAVELLDVCYQEDPINAVGLIEQTHSKWGKLDCLEMAYIANDLMFISAPCAQATVDLNWRRGIIKASTLAILIANVFPLIIFFPNIFTFQNLGDDFGELTKWQKLIVFYKSPISKFYAHTTSYVLFLLLYSYVVLFDFHFQMSPAEIFLVIWVLAMAVEKIYEVYTEQSSTFWGKVKDWSDSVWSRFDVVSILMACIALGLRIHRNTFKWGRIVYTVNTTVFYCRLFRMYHVNYHLGPKLVIFYRMITEVLVFMALLVIFILGYGIASQGLLHPTRYAYKFNVSSTGQVFEEVLLTPYWQMYGELLLDQLVGHDKISCHEESCQAEQSCQTPSEECLADCVCENPREYAWVVNVMLFFYLIIGNIMLLNLLIAIFTYVFDEVQENSMEIWKFEMYRLMREYDKKPILVPPFVLLEHAWRLLKGGWALLCTKAEESKDYLTDAMITLRIIEKEATLSFLSKINIARENSIEMRVKRMSEKIDRVAKYIDQKEEMEEIEEDMVWVRERSSDKKKEDSRPTSHDLTKHVLPNIHKGKRNDFDDDDEDEDNEIEYELADLFAAVEPVGAAKAGGLSAPPSNQAPSSSRPPPPQSEDGLSKMYRRMDSLETRLNAFQQNVTQKLEVILNKLDKEAK